MKSKGFTLIEVMIVVAIIGVLAAIAIPSFKKYIADAREAEMVSALLSVHKDEMRVETTFGRFTEVFKAAKPCTIFNLDDSTCDPELDYRMAAKPRFNIITGALDASRAAGNAYSLQEVIDPGFRPVNPFGFSQAVDSEGRRSRGKFIIGAEGDIDGDDFMHVLMVSENGTIYKVCDDVAQTQDSIGGAVYASAASRAANCNRHGASGGGGVGGGGDEGL